MSSQHALLSINPIFHTANAFYYNTEMPVNEEEVRGLTPPSSTAIEVATVTERNTSARHSDISLPENSYLYLQVSENTGHTKVANNVSQVTLIQNNVTCSSPLPIRSLNTACALTSDALTSNSSNEQEEHLSSDDVCVSMRDGHEYHIVDPKKMDKAEQVYMNRRNPPPPLPKDHSLKHLGTSSHSTPTSGGTCQATRSLSSLESNPMKTEVVYPSPPGRTVNERNSLSQADSQKDDVFSQIPVGAQCIGSTVKSFDGNDTAYFVASMQPQVQNTHCNESEPQQYQSLIPNTKDYSSIYSSPQAIPGPPVSQMFHDGMEYHYI